MKYSELERLLKKSGAKLIGYVGNGHPIWHCPKTGKDVLTSHHKSKEVAKGTLNKILKHAGLK